MDSCVLCFLSHNNRNSSLLLSLVALEKKGKECVKNRSPNTGPSYYSFADLLKAHLANMSSVTFVLNTKSAGYSQLNLWQFTQGEHPLFCISGLATGIRWIPQHPQMLPRGNKDIHLVLSHGSFFSHFTLVETRGKRWPTTRSQHKMASQSVINFGHFAKVSLKTCDALLVKRCLGNVAEGTSPDNFTL